MVQSTEILFPVPPAPGPRGKALPEAEPSGLAFADLLQTLPANAPPRPDPADVAARTCAGNMTGPPPPGTGHRDDGNGPPLLEEGEIAPSPGFAAGLAAPALPVPVAPGPVPEATAAGRRPEATAPAAAQAFSSRPDSTASPAGMGTSPSGPAPAAGNQRTGLAAFDSPSPPWPNGANAAGADGPASQGPVVAPAALGLELPSLPASAAALAGQRFLPLAGPVFTHAAAGRSAVPAFPASARQMPISPTMPGLPPVSAGQDSPLAATPMTQSGDPSPEDPQEPAKDPGPRPVIGPMPTTLEGGSPVAGPTTDGTAPQDLSAAAVVPAAVAVLPDTNAAAQPARSAAAAEYHRLQPQIMPVLVAQLGQEGSRVEVVLSPQDLGRLHFDIRHSGDEICILVSAERPETLDTLRRHADQILQDLRQAGFAGAGLGFGAGQQRGPLPEPALPDVDIAPSPPGLPGLRPTAPPRPPAAGLDLRL